MFQNAIDQTQLFYIINFYKLIHLLIETITAHKYTHLDMSNPFNFVEQSMKNGYLLELWKS
jgi:hypothetical protein